MKIPNLQSVFGGHRKFSSYEGLKLLEKNLLICKKYIPEKNKISCSITNRTEHNPTKFN